MTRVKCGHGHGVWNEQRACVAIEEIRCLANSLEVFGLGDEGENGIAVVVVAAAAAAAAADKFVVRLVECLMRVVAPVAVEGKTSRCSFDLVFSLLG